MDEIHKIFDIEPSDRPTLEVGNVIIPDTEDDANAEDRDFRHARQNYYEIIEQSKAAIQTAMMIAAETQNPRAIEVLSGLLKNTADINRQLVQMSKDKQEVKVTKAQATGKAGPAAPAIGTQQNITFVGTSADINKLIADKMASMKG